MAKSSGGTRSSASNNPRGISSGRFMQGSQRGQLATVDFPSDIKFSELLDEGQFVNGGSYSIMNRNNDTLRFTLENGYNDDYGSDGTLVVVSFQRSDRQNETILTNFFVEGDSFRESGGRNVYSNQDAIKRRIEGGMPYYVELANRSLRGNLI